MKAIPTLILVEDISVKIIGRGKKIFPESHFSSFVMKEHGNLWKLR